MQPTGFLVMGVSGSGKSTLGKALVLAMSTAVDEMLDTINAGYFLLKRSLN